MRTRVFGLVVLGFLFASGNALATTYYVSATGTDGMDGTTQGKAWQSIARVNAQKTLVAGDQVLFEAGQRFYGTIAAANGVTYGAYGTGAKPIITGFSTIGAATFKSVGGKLWEAPVPAGGTSLRSLVIAGALQPIARYPKATGPNDGYLTFKAHGSDQTWIADTDLQALIGTDLPAGTSFVGGEIVLRMVHWLKYRTPILSQDATGLHFAAFGNTSVYPLVDGYGYFVQNHPSAATQNGDWYYRAATTTVGAYFAGAPSDVEVPTLDHLVTFGKTTGASFQGLAFEGANAEAIYGTQGVSSITIQGCDIRFAGTFAIYLTAATDILIDGNTVTSSVNDGISVQGRTNATTPVTDNLTVSNNVITDTGTIMGMGQTGDGQNVALNVIAQVGASITKNVIKNTGYLPLNFQGDSVVVQNNVIDTYCNVLDDGAGIYTYDGPMTTFSDRHVIGNIVTNGIGAPLGTQSGLAQANGIYLDNNTNHVEVTGNTVYHVANTGLYANSPEYVTMTDNTVFDVAEGMGLTRWLPVDLNGGQDINNLDIEHNLFVSTTRAQTAFHYDDQGVNVPSASTIQARLDGMGTFANNTYYTPNLAPFVYVYRNDTTSAYQTPPADSLAQWQLFTTLETSTTSLPPLPTYTPGTLGANLYPAGDFEDPTVQSKAAKMTPYLPPANTGTYTLAWNGTSAVDGTGSLEVTFGGAPGANDVLYLTSSIGNLTSAHSYLVRFTTVGTTEQGHIRAAIRKSTTPYNDLQASQLVPFGTAKAAHEVLVTFPMQATEPVGASIEFQLSMTSGTTYLDDVQVFQVDPTLIDPSDYLTLEVNPTDTPMSFLLDKTYTDAKGTPYCGTTMVAPFASLMLFASTVDCTPMGGQGGAGGSGQGGSTGNAGSSGLGGMTSSAGGSLGTAGAAGAGGSSVGVGGANNGGEGGSAQAGSGGAGEGGHAGEAGMGTSGQAGMGTSGHAGDNGMGTSGHAGNGAGAASGAAGIGGAAGSKGGSTSSSAGTTAHVGGAASGQGGASGAAPSPDAATDADSSDSGGCSVAGAPRGADSTPMWVLAIALGVFAKRARRRLD